MELQTKRLLLRDFRSDDFTALCILEQLPATYYYERGTPTIAETHDLLQQTIREANEQPRIYFRFVVMLHDDLIGRVKLIRLNAEINEWEIGWTFHEDHWGQGYATEAALALLKFGFEDLGVHRIVAFCNANNAASYRVMEKIGMHRDGHLREALKWRGEWSDEFVYSILDREWR
jgi:[ribosomal protein S5]-alanine N-acetyltransferase